MVPSSAISRARRRDRGRRYSGHRFPILARLVALASTRTLTSLRRRSVRVSPFSLVPPSPLSPSEPYSFLSLIHLRKKRLPRATATQESSRHGIRRSSTYSTVLTNGHATTPYAPRWLLNSRADPSRMAIGTSGLTGRRTTYSLIMMRMPRSSDGPNLSLWSTISVRLVGSHPLWGRYLYVQFLRLITNQRNECLVGSDFCPTLFY